MRNSMVLAVVLVTALCGVCHSADRPTILDEFENAAPAASQGLSQGAAVQIGAAQNSAGIWSGIPSSAVADGLLTIHGPSGGARISSVDRIRYGKFTIKFRLTGLAGGNYVYLGFFSRDKWGVDDCIVMLDGDRFHMQIHREGGKLLLPFESPVVTPGEWHTLAIDWRPGSVELIYDGVSCGKVTDAANVPEAFVPAIIDVVQESKQELTFEVDSVRVDGGEVKRADRTGYDAVPPPVRTPPDTRSVAWPKRTAPSVKVKGTFAVIENAFYRAELNWSDGLRISSLRNKVTGLSCLAPNSFSELFKLGVGGDHIASSDFAVTASAARPNSLELTLADQKSGWGATLVLRADNSPEIRIGLTLQNGASESRGTAIFWPHLSGLQIGAKASDNYYLFPWKGGWVQNRPAELGTMYGLSSGLIQMCALMNPSAGSSVYTYLKDSSGDAKTIIMKKLDKPNTEVPSYVPFWPELKDPAAIPDLLGTQFSYRFLPRDIAPGARVELPELVLAVSPGDWRPALQSYSKWAHTWFRAPAIPEWYKALFQTIAVHDNLGNYGFYKGFVKNGEWALAEQTRPGDGLVEVVGWWKHHNTDFIGPEKITKPAWFKLTTGQYDYWDELGGLDRLRAEIKGVHDKGVHVTLYTCPRFAWEFSDIAKAHPEWVLKNHDGSVSEDWSVHLDGVTALMLDMCYSFEGWRDYMAKTVGRIVRDTGCDGVFMDTMNDAKFCYDPTHKHTESNPIMAEKMLKAIRSELKAANPNAIMSSEDACSDRLLQYVDGCLVKTFEGTTASFSDHDLYGIHFVRFYFPEVKFAEWGSIFEHGARRAFFNGVAYMRGDMGECTDPFTGKKMSSKEQLAYLTMTSRIMSANADAFHSRHPEPLVPTLVPKLYANRFPGKHQTVWTLYNRTGKSLNANAIRVKHIRGAKYVNLVTGKEVKPVVKKGEAVLKLSMGNGEVTAVAQRTPSWKPD